MTENMGCYFYWSFVLCQTISFTGKFLKIGEILVSGIVRVSEGFSAGPQITPLQIKYRTMPMSSSNSRLKAL